MKSLTRPLVAVGLSRPVFPLRPAGCADEPLAAGDPEADDDVGDPDDEEVEATSDEVRVALARAQSLSASGARTRRAWRPALSRRSPSSRPQPRAAPWRRW